MNYIDKKERINFYAGLSGQNLVYSFIGGSFFTYFMTDIALFPAIVVTVLLFIMKIWDGVNDPIVGSFIDRHRFKNGEKLRPFLRYTPLPVGVFTVLIFLVFFNCRRYALAACRILCNHVHSVGYCLYPAGCFNMGHHGLRIARQRRTRQLCQMGTNNRLVRIRRIQYGHTHDD